MRYLNLGIVAHVDAGKTSLTERLLFQAGVIAEPGSVDAGTTQTDTLLLERQRGITIKAAVVSFVVGDVTINLIDTPGHPDFIAQVERVLGVLDGAIIVISAVEGIQPQTRVLMRTLQRLRIPTLLFINKIDRSGADPERVAQEIATKLTSAIFPMGTTHAAGTHSAAFLPSALHEASFRLRLIELLAERSDSLLAAFVADEEIAPQRLAEELSVQTQRGFIAPIFFGSAITGAGVDALIAGITTLLPAQPGIAHGPPAGTIFKIERVSGSKVAYLRLFSGTLAVRQRLQLSRGRMGRITALSVFERGNAIRRERVGGGQIAKVWGLDEAQIGDVIGELGTRPLQHVFAPPTLETLVVPCRPTDRSALHVALSQLADQDPLINVRRAELREELFVSLYGEVQKEVIQATLANEFALEVSFHETTPICIECPVGVGTAVEVIGKGANPFLATIGLRIEPAAVHSGIVFRVEAELNIIPLHIYKSSEGFGEAIEDAVRQTLRQGLYGWQVTDCVVTLTRSGYWSPASSALDFRRLTPLVLMSALQAAGTVVCEPIHRFWLDTPADAIDAVSTVLARYGAAVHSQELRGRAYLLEGTLLATKMHMLQQLLPGLTHGEGVLETAFDHHQPVQGAPPSRARTDQNPLNRREYLLRLAGRA